MPRNEYTDRHIDQLINEMLPRHNRDIKNWEAIGMRMGFLNFEGLDDIVWKWMTGYAGKNADGPRRVYVRTSVRHSPRDAYMPNNPLKGAWSDREVEVMFRCLWRPWMNPEIKDPKKDGLGQGFRRDPPTDVGYVAAILNRTVKDVIARWRKYRADNARSKPTLKKAIIASR